MDKENTPITLAKEEQVDVYCAFCNEPINSSNINVKDSLAKCNACNSVFSLEEAAFEKRRRGYPIFFVPEGTEVLKLFSSLEITTSWLRSSKKDKFKFDFIFATIFSIVSSVAFFGGLLAGSALLSIFSSFFLVASLILLYLFLANLINKTVIRIEEETLSIQHKPLKFISWKNRRIPLKTIRQLFVKEYNSNRSVNNEPLKAYGLYILTGEDKEIKIIEDMNKETSLYIEQEIEEFLTIPDQRIRGELEKP